MENIDEKKLYDIVPQSIKDIFQIFKKYDRKLYLVGGAVRDFINGEKPKDFDVCTDALPDEVISMLLNYKVNLQGKAFGVVVVYTDDSPEGIEIATFRQDTSKGRNPTVKLGVTIEDDVKRRDLTYNSLFYDLDTKKIVDLVGGVDDLKNKITRMVGDPFERLEEDSLRILRAFRFASRYETTLDEKLIQTLKRRNNLSNMTPDDILKRISGERIWDEIKKSFKQAKDFTTYLNYFTEFDMWGEVFPGIDINTELKKFSKLYMYIAYLFIKDNDSIKSLEKKMLFEYRMESENVDKILFLKQFISTFNENNVLEFFKLKEKVKISNNEIKEFVTDNKFIKNDINNINKFFLYTPSIKSEDLIEKGFVGKQLGDEIKRLEKEAFLSL